jgi:TfoX/Sxy family transcriptional regulator of competence genes
VAWTKSPQSLIDLFDKSVPPGANISRRKMFGYPAAFANGNLFIGLHQNDFIMRLSEQDRARFSAEFGERTFEPMAGRPMREYVRLPEKLLTDPRKRASGSIFRCGMPRQSHQRRSPQRESPCPTGERESDMKKFVLLHYGFEKPTPEIMAAWGKWFEATKPHIVDMGGFGNGREISKAGTKDLPLGPDAITGFTIVNAANLDAAEKMAQGNPFISSIRVYEVRSG